MSLKEQASFSQAPKKAATKTGSQFSLFENWPGWLFNAPLALWWMVLAVRYWSLTLPTIANPRLPLGGLCGESKEVLLKLLGPVGRSHLAPYVLYTTDSTKNAEEAIKAQTAFQSAGFTYPLVAKPDIGRNGTGVQIVRTREELARYLDAFPRATGLILQQLAIGEGEAGVFYIRAPGAAIGHIVSLTLKYFPRVTGDGVRTLRQLIVDDPRAGHLTHLYFPRLRERLDEIPVRGKTIPLVSVGNHAKGAIFEDGGRHITKSMEARFDEIAREMPDFRFGRFDVRYTSLEDLKKGDGFTIVEYNGVSSEPTHILARDMSLGKAYHDYFSTLSLAFALGNEYRERGWRPATLREIYPIYKQELDLLPKYPQGKEL